MHLLVPHAFAGAECDGQLEPRENNSQVALTCDECGAVVRLVPVTDVQRTLLEIALPHGLCSARCQHCGSFNAFPGFDQIEAFVCEYCGSKNLVPVTDDTRA